ncbi:hypothetical protein GP5015_1555 [gamma proteobacterium HTCC5015]|nr:hypothetical protein GP5015_1555 [gamma proteobacterium HTCC5015]
MPDHSVLLQLAHDLVGVRGVYRGREFTLIEVMDDGPSVVLEPTETDNVVQNTAQGEAKRYAQSSYTLPFLSPVNGDIHPVLQDFLGNDILAVLRESIADTQAP